MSENKVINICEVIAPGEVYILYKDGNEITYVGNKNGKAFVGIAKEEINEEK